jgi:hypothetical protein
MADEKKELQHCKKCNADLLSEHFGFKRNGDVYKTCIGCRKRCKKYYKIKSKSKKLPLSLGCPIEDFLKYIEDQFDENMSWDNFTIDWHLRHKTPIKNIKTREDLHKYFGWENVIPAWD